MTTHQNGHMIPEQHFYRALVPALRIVSPMFLAVITEQSFVAKNQMFEAKSAELVGEGPIDSKTLVLT